MNIVAHTYPFLADMLGADNTAKSYEYEDSINFWEELQFLNCKKK